MANKRRVYQIAEKIRNVIASELYHLGDPRFEMVTITSVVVSADLGHAKVYWVTSGDEVRRGEVDAAFQTSAKALRRSVAQDLGTRVVPELRFYYDDTLDTVAKVDELFDRVRKSDEALRQKNTQDEGGEVES